MVKVLDRVRMYKNDKFLDVNALFNTGSAKSYVAERVAKGLGYKQYDKPRKVPLAVENYEAEVIGGLTCFLEIAGYRLPIEETLGVIKDLRVDVIIGIDIIELYEIALERDRITLKRVPPMPYLI